MDTASKKAALRSQLRAARKAITPEARQELEAAFADRLIELPEIKDARCIGVYYAEYSELDLTVTIEKLRAQIPDVSIVYPLVTSTTEMVFARFEAGDDLSELCNPKRLFTEFADVRLVEPADLDVLLLPGVGFDKRGYRLGQGGGYYDRYLPQLRKDCVTIGTAFDEQIVDEVPINEYDQSVDYLVTPTQVVKLA